MPNGVACGKWAWCRLLRSRGWCEDGCGWVLCMGSGFRGLLPGLLVSSHLVSSDVPGKKLFLPKLCILGVDVRWLIKGSTRTRSLGLSSHPTPNFLPGHKLSVCRSETVAVVEHQFEFVHSASLFWERGENTLEDRVQGVGNGENLFKEIGVTKKFAEGFIRSRCLLPRIAAADKVDQDDTQTPHVVGDGVVGLRAAQNAALAFGPHVKGRPTAEVRAVPVGCGQPKVSQHHTGPSLKAHDVFGFEIAVVNAKLVAVLNRVDNLTEHVFDGLVHIGPGVQVLIILHHVRSDNVRGVCA